METKRHIYKSVYLLTLTYESESYIMLDKQASRITAAKFVRSAVGKTRRFEVMELKTTLKSRQLKYFCHVCCKGDEIEPKKVLEAQPSGKIPRGRPRISYHENIQRIGKKKRQNNRGSMTLIRTQRGRQRRRSNQERIQLQL